MIYKWGLGRGEKKELSWCSFCMRDLSLGGDFMAVVTIHMESILQVRAILAKIDLECLETAQANRNK
ncbi:hypothetical protein DSO57_1018864 [Entomophthora muscae]|uniref:Uncharacterized protein n=1 Tax=Entomophthora muscae TaxID=34485 RepID=A0ACC2RIX7_9FUNG|nr:hypothetical protein DSO57_1018864 [Entomophthora muscae]